MQRGYDEFSRVFKALGDPSRLELVHILIREEGTLSVSALGKGLAISQSTISQHLRVLRDAGIIRSERRGTSIHYRMDWPRLRELQFRFRSTFGELRLDAETTRS
jgi:DNA-binding transcriptional ArsR family regulator